jgi:hypothetical protein
MVPAWEMAPMRSPTSAKHAFKLFQNVVNQRHTVIGVHFGLALRQYGIIQHLIAQFGVFTG